MSRKIAFATILCVLFLASLAATAFAVDEPPPAKKATTKHKVVWTDQDIAKEFGAVDPVAYALLVKVYEAGKGWQVGATLDEAHRYRILAEQGSHARSTLWGMLVRVDPTRIGTDDATDPDGITVKTFLKKVVQGIPRLIDERAGNNDGLLQKSEADERARLLEGGNLLLRELVLLAIEKGAF